MTSKGIIGEPLRNSDHRNKDFLGLVCTNYLGSKLTTRISSHHT